MPRNINAVDFGSYTITATPGTLFSFADSGMPSEMPQGAHCFKGRLETAPIRIRIDDTAVTSNVGELLSAGDDILLDDSMLLTASLVRDTGTSGKIQGHFYSNEAHVFVGGG